MEGNLNNNNELQQIFEYELKRKLAEKSKTTMGELRILLNGFKFYDLEYTGIIDKDKWIKGILRTGLSGFSDNDLSNIFSCYDLNNSGMIDYKNFSAFLYGREELNPLPKQQEKINNENNNNINDNTNKNINNQNLLPQNNIRKTPINFQNNNLNNFNDNNEMIQNNNFINDNNNQINQIRNQRTPTPINYQKKLNLNNNLNNFDNNYNKNNSVDIKSAISQIQNIINTNSGITFYTFIDKLKSYEDQNTKSIFFEDFIRTLQEMRINLPSEILLSFFNSLNPDFNNRVSLNNLINIIKGNIDERRKLFVVGKFANMDTEKKGMLSVNLLKNMYNSKQHPDVLLGTKSEKEVFDQFCDTIDIFIKINGISDMITFEQFIDYYSGISASIPNDIYFEDLLNGVWSGNVHNENINNSITTNENSNLNDNFENNNNIQNNIDSNNFLNSNNNINSNKNNQCVSNNNNFNNSRNNYNQENIDDIGLNRLFLGIGSNESKDRRERFGNNMNNNNNYNQQKIKNSISTPLMNITQKDDNRNNQYSQNFSNNTPLSRTPLISNDPVQNMNGTGIRKFNTKLRYNPITNEYLPNEYTQNQNMNSSNSNYNNNYNNNNYNNNNRNYNNNFNNNNINYNNNNNFNRTTPLKKTDLYSNNNENVDVINELINLLKSRGTKMIFTFQRMFTLYDRNHTGEVTYDNFYSIFETYNLNMNQQSIKNICNQFDINNKGKIKYINLLKSIINNINPRKQSIIQNLFNIFNKDQQGNVLINDIKKLFNPKRHPDVVSGKKSPEEIFGDFLDELEIFREYIGNLKGNYITDLNFEEFNMFFGEIGVGIDDVNLFEYFICNCWNLDRNMNNNNNGGNVNNVYENNNRGNNNNYGQNVMAVTGKQIMNNNIF